MAGRPRGSQPVPGHLPRTGGRVEVHHDQLIITEGQDSYRLAQATAGKGVKPLA
jgi:hypothetical protein